MLKTIAELIAETKQSINCITAEEAAVKCRELQGVVIDVRETAERDQKALASTVHIPRGVLEMKMLSLYPDAKQPLFIHCASGVRACLAAEQLTRLGYENVWAITCQLDGVIATQS